MPEALIAQAHGMFRNPSVPRCGARSRALSSHHVSTAPRARQVPAQAFAAPALAAAVATPILATGNYLLRDPNMVVGLSAIMGAAAMELARRQNKTQRVALVALAAASPWAMQQGLATLIARVGIDIAQVPVQVMLDTGLAAMAGTTVALFSSLVRPPWAPDAPAAIEGAVGPLVARFVLAAALAPVAYHALMAAAVPQVLQHGAQAIIYGACPAFVLAAHA